MVQWHGHVRATNKANQVEELFGFGGQILERGGQADGLDLDGVQSACQTAGLADGLADKSNQFRGLRGMLGSLTDEVLLEGFGAKSDAGQELAQAVVQFVADPA